MTDTQYFAVILAGGRGSRFNQGLSKNPSGDALKPFGSTPNQSSNVPKQYQHLLGKTVLEHSVARVCGALMPARTVLTHPKGDTTIKKLGFALPVDYVVGGLERMHSVLNALEHLRPFAQDDDFVLVHDAARPCVLKKDILQLVRATKDHAVGGLLAVPVTDTIKQVDADGAAVKTIPRAQIWAAQTPQLLRFGLFFAALKQAVDKGWHVTDDASALELAGFKPLVVAGSPSNIKITHASDLEVARVYMRSVQAL